MTSTKFESAILVLGMHRSGTSALAGVLSRCGFAPPLNLIPPREGNERGFFEAESINGINTAILSDLQQSWYTLDRIDPKALQSPTMDRKRDHIASLVASEFPQATIPLIKDPRVCRLFPLWSDALARVSKELFLPVIIRSPIEVARSLESRNQFDTEFGLLLWARYHLDLERDTRGRRRRFISYDQLMGDWRQALSQLDLPIDPSAIEADWIDDFLAGDMRHHRAEPAATDRYPTIAEVEHIMMSWAATGHDRPDDYSRLDALRATLDDVAPLVDDLFNKGRLERKRRIGITADASAIKSELQRARRSLEDFGDIKRDLKALAAERKAVAELNGLLNQARSKIDTLVVDRRQLDVRLAQALADLQTTKTGLQVAAAQAEQAKAQSAELRAARDVVERKYRGAVARVEESNSHAAELRTASDLVKQKYRSTQVILERERAKVQRLRQGNDSANSALAQLKMGWGYRLESRLHSLTTRSARLFRFAGSRRAERQAKLRQIRESDLFDPTWYLDQYPDVAAAKVDPAQHFLDLGWREGRSPSAAFSTRRYLAQHADVAALAINPLLHYIEHGRFEGREYSGTGLPAPAAVARPPAEGPPRPPAAPVFRDTRPQSETGAWRRACHLIADERAIVVDGLGLGIATATVGRDALEAALADLLVFTGESGNIAVEPMSAGQLPDWVDGWFASTRRLITRWAVDEGTVLRAVQVDPSTGRLDIVGESLACSSLDLVEFDLIAPMLPLLLVATTPDGDITGLACLAFPSLFRGGLHYVEALADAADQRPLDPVAFSATLERRLRALRSGNARPLVKTIKVDLGGADASTPLFQRDLRDLLERVIGINMAPVEREATGPREDFIAAAVKLKARRARTTGAALTLSADMVPSLTLLVAEADAAAESRELAMPLAIVSPDSSQPAVCFVPPPMKDASLALRSPAHGLPFPRLRGRFATSPMAAIRTLSRPLDDAELLVPDMALMPDPAAHHVAIDWLVAPSEWNDELLARAIAALRLQRGVARQRLLLIGEAGPSATEAAQSLFREDVVGAADRKAALALAEAPLVGFLGGGVVLHDARTAAILASLAMDRSAVSASCILVRSEKRGKLWKTNPVDGGKLPVDRKLVHGAMATHPAEMIWRATYPVVEPPHGLWLSRLAHVRSWHDGELVQKGFHFMTSVISASHVAEGDVTEGEVAIAPMPSPDRRSLQAKVLVG